MVVRQGLRSVTLDLLDAVFRPSQFVEARTSTYAHSLRARLDQASGLASVYAVNLAMYAIPLTLAGFGLETVGAPPAVFAATVGQSVPYPAMVWQFTAAFVQNSAYITAAVVVTLLTYHAGVVLTLNSRGFTQSLHTVVYSSSVYLAGLFTAVWYLTTNAGVEQARVFVRTVQAAFVYAVIDLVGADLHLAVARPDAVALGQLSFRGELLLALIVVLLGYYLYSLYLGSRVNHQMTRTSATLILVAVATAPVLYVVASIVAATTTFP